MKIAIVAGARPNFMKIAPLAHELDKRISEGARIEYDIIHTGQHYDEKLSDSFFSDLNIPLPSVNLGVGSGTQSEQTAGIMIGFEKYLASHKTDLVIVVGDVTSTMACSIVAKKMLLKLAHVEAGIRSFDLTMPEEINRMVTDSLTDYFFTTSERANQNLISTGVKEENIFFVGNTMIDTLIDNLPRLKKPFFWDKFNLDTDDYLVATLHRPSNVDSLDNLNSLLTKILNNTTDLKIIFPVHPRTKKNFDQLDIDLKRLVAVEPMGYLEFIFLIKNSKGVITDSGGIQEETTYLNIPCLTLRPNTERPETIEMGSNELAEKNKEGFESQLQRISTGNWKEARIPEKWDGSTAKRIVETLLGKI